MEPKPIAGYPSRTAACMALHGQGLGNRQISDRLGIALSTVAALICKKLQRSGAEGAKVDELHRFGRRVVVSQDILDALAPDATRRGLSIDALVTAILGAVVDDGLVAVVLDDEPDHPIPAIPHRNQQVHA